MTINTVFLHKAVMIPKSGKTENHINQQKLPGVNSWLDGQFLFFKYNGVTCSTPVTNIDLIWWDPQPEGVELVSVKAKTYKANAPSPQS